MSKSKTALDRNPEFEEQIFDIITLPHMITEWGRALIVQQHVNKVRISMSADGSSIMITRIQPEV